MSYICSSLNKAAQQTYIIISLQACLRALGFPVKKREVLDMLKVYSKDQTDTITYNEFEEILTEKFCSRDKKDEIAQAFSLFDVGKYFF